MRIARLACLTSLALAACSSPPAPTDAAGDGAIDATADTGADAPGLDAGGGVPVWVGVTHGTDKLRPASSLPTSRVALIEAARNEWEPYQIAFAGSLDGRSVSAIVPSALTGPGGAVIPVSQSFVYVEPLVTVPMPSSVEGASGPWPDPLVPVVDLLVGETREHALPITIPRFELRAAWVDVLVPNDAAPGDYTGSVHVTSNEGEFDVPVQLHVFDFALPSTPTLHTMFGGPGDDPCVAHHRGAWTGGAWDACADSDPMGDGDRLTEHYRQQYMQLALEYRISLGGGVYVGPTDAASLAHFDAVYGGLLDGTAPRHLAGSRLTTLEVQYNGAPSTATTQLLVDHASAMGWSPTIFDYTSDEPESNGVCPSGGGSCPTITGRASIVTAGHARSLVTAQLRYAQASGFASAVQILVPIVNDTQAMMPAVPLGQPVSDYAPWLAASPENLLWWYQSCESHGCGPADTCGSTMDTTTGYPSYAIDAAAVQARAMEWLSYARGITGELYYDTTYGLAEAWTNPCSFGGAGDGTMFYPGTTDRIGGTTDVPVASIRMALVREGVEDYEYLTLLAARGGAADAQRIANDLFPTVDRVTARFGDDVMAARHALALAIEARR